MSQLNSALAQSNGVCQCTGDVWATSALNDPLMYYKALMCDTRMTCSRLKAAYLNELV